MTGTTITERLDSGESIDEQDLRNADTDELVAVILNESYPISLRDAAHAALVELEYEFAKLRDRVSPGRTPWQELRRRAILVTASRLGEPVSSGGSPELDELTAPQRAALELFAELHAEAPGSWHRRETLELGRNGFKALTALSSAGLIEEQRAGRLDEWRYDRRITARGLSVLGLSISTGGSPELDEVRGKAAEAVVLDRFDTLRSHAGHDYGAGQRASELRRIKAELSSTPATTVDYIVERELELELTAEELLAAFERVSAPKLRRLNAESYRASTPASRRTAETWNRLERELLREKSVAEAESIEEIAEAARDDVEQSIAARLESEADVVAEASPRFFVSAVSVGDAGLTARPAVSELVPGEKYARNVKTFRVGEEHLAEQLAAELNAGERAAELRRKITELELELEKIERPDVAELREELDGLETGLAIARHRLEFRGLARLALNARDRVYGTPGVPSDVHRRVDDVVARARAKYEEAAAAGAGLEQTLRYSREEVKRI